MIHNKCSLNISTGCYWHQSFYSRGEWGVFLPYSHLSVPLVFPGGSDLSLKDKTVAVWRADLRFPCLNFLAAQLRVFPSSPPSCWAFLKCIIRQLAPLPVTVRFLIFRRLSTVWFLCELQTNSGVTTACLLPCRTSTIQLSPVQTIIMLTGFSLRNAQVNLIWLESTLNSREILPDGAVLNECLTCSINAKVWIPWAACKGHWYSALEKMWVAG